MKKILLAVTMLSFILVGCGNSDVEGETLSTVCSGINNGVTITNTITYEGDKVNTITYENSYSFDVSLLDTMKEAAEQYKNSVVPIKGITYEYKIQENTLIETTVIDYNETDMQELVDLQMITVREDGQIPDYIGYEMTIQNMKDIGLSCQ